MNKQKCSDNDKITIIDNIIDMFPEIKQKRTDIINRILCPKDIKTDEHILEKITVNGKDYYRDKYKSIIDVNGDLKGIWEWNYEKNMFDYYIFEDERAKFLKNIKDLHL